jgi:hypothetical protein
MSVRIYVGDVTQELAKSAKSYNPTAFLIDHSNYKEFLTTEYSSDIVVFTALGDLPKDLEIFYNILLKADEIVYFPPNHWSGNQVLTNVDPTMSIQGLTENILLIISNHRPVENIEVCYLKNHLAKLVDLRKTDKSQLWIAGCSISHGTGVDPGQRYGQLIAKELGLECSFLTKPGSSIQWAADQLLRSDIRPGDVVVWGITDSCRLSYVYNNQYLPGINCNTYTEYPEIEKIVPFSELFSENTLYNNICSIEKVINFCKKIDVNLGMLGILPTMPNFYRYIKSKPGYIDFPYKIKWRNNSTKEQYQDLGTDNEHPGPVQHQHYKTFIQNHFNIFNQQQ